jgi:hypothetical protein
MNRMTWKSRLLAIALLGDIVVVTFLVSFARPAAEEAAISSTLTPSVASQSAIDRRAHTCPRYRVSIISHGTHQLLDSPFNRDVELSTSRVTSLVSLTECLLIRRESDRPVLNSFLADVPWRGIVRPAEGGILGREGIGPGCYSLSEQQQQQQQQHPGGSSARKVVFRGRHLFNNGGVNLDRNFDG